MASEIIVNTIKAPTTGANANKVIIPSGVSLDLSSASDFKMPSGRYSIYQMGSDSRTESNQSVNTSHNGESSTVFPVIGGCEVTLTPKSADSIFIVHMHLAWIANNNKPALSPQCEINGTVRQQLNSTNNTTSTSLTGHRYNGHRVQQDGNKHYMSIGYGYYSAVGTGAHTFRIRPYLYNEGNPVNLTIGGGGSTQIHVMEIAQ